VDSLDKRRHNFATLCLVEVDDLLADSSNVYSKFIKKIFKLRSIRPTCASDSKLLVYLLIWSRGTPGGQTELLKLCWLVKLKVITSRDLHTSWLYFCHPAVYEKLLIVRINFEKLLGLHVPKELLGKELVLHFSIRSICKPHPVGRMSASMAS